MPKYEFKKDKFNNNRSDYFLDFSVRRKGEANTIKNRLKNTRIKYIKPINKTLRLELDLDRDFKGIQFKKKF
tara:strand:+ start:860 stop:1075 length:216 start_codon:yes stop_codon:yes gene_type:complete